jgi:hypothetical protein
MLLKIKDYAIHPPLVSLVVDLLLLRHLVVPH